MAGCDALGARGSLGEKRKSSVCVHHERGQVVRRGLVKTTQKKR